MSIHLNQKQVAAAGHTLWQAALASGGLATISESLFGAKVDLSGVEQGAGVAAIAVGASAASLLKGYVVNFLTARAAKKASSDELASKVQGMVQQFMSYRAKLDYDAAHAVAPSTPLPSPGQESQPLSVAVAT